MEQDQPIVNSAEEAAVVQDGQHAQAVASGAEMASPVASGVEHAPVVREVAYSITDRYFGDFPVYKSANAWWMTKTKVDALIEAFKAGHTIKAACVYAGITERQYKYFNEVHPDFCTIKAACEEVQMFKAMNTVNSNLEDPKTARWFVQRRHPAFRSKVDEDGDDVLKPTVPTPAVQVAVQVENNIDAGAIAAALRDVAREVFGADEGSAAAMADQAVEGVPSTESR